MVRKTIAVALVVTLLPTSGFAQVLAPKAALGQSIASWKPSDDMLFTQDCGASREGRVDAGTRHGAAGWFLGGVGAGVGLGLIGAGVITAASAIGSPQPKEVPPGSEENCYRSGYSGKAKNKNVLSAFLGGLVGTGAWLAIYVANHEE